MDLEEPQLQLEPAEAKKKQYPILKAEWTPP
jgi:hypothetical protein